MRPDEERIDLQQLSGLPVVEGGLDVGYHQAMAFELDDQLGEERLALVELDQTELELDDAAACERCRGARKRSRQSQQLSATHGCPQHTTVVSAQ